MIFVHADFIGISETIDKLNQAGLSPSKKVGEKLVELAPKELTKINLKLTNDGSDANESAFKRVRKKHGKSKII